MSEPTIDVTRYPYRVTWSVEAHQSVATCVERYEISDVFEVTGTWGLRPSGEASL